MKSTIVTGCIALTAILSSCQKPENTSYTPADSFVIGDAAFFERFENRYSSELKVEKRTTYVLYYHDFFHGGLNTIRAFIDGRSVDAQGVDGARRLSNYWMLTGVEVLGEMQELPYLVTYDAASKTELSQLGTGFSNPFTDTLIWNPETLVKLVKPYSMGDTVNWEEDDELLNQHEWESLGEYNKYHFNERRNDWANIYERTIIEEPYHKEGVEFRISEENYSIDLSENKFIVCKYLWQPENPPAGFDDEIEKLMVIEIALTQDSLIDVVNVYNEKYQVR